MNQHRSPILRRYASKLVAKANRADDRAIGAGQDSAARLVVRADMRARRVARKIGLSFFALPDATGLVLAGRPVHLAAVGRGARITAGRVGPGTGKGKPCRDGYDRGHM